MSTPPPERVTSGSEDGVDLVVCESTPFDAGGG